MRAVPRQRATRAVAAARTDPVDVRRAGPRVSAATRRAIIGVVASGTFTDVVAIRDGAIETVKLPIDLTETASGVLSGAAEIGAAHASIFNHASTHGLNAVITRRLPKIVLLTTEGHRDILDVGRCWRPVDGLTYAGWRRQSAPGSPAICGASCASG